MTDERVDLISKLISMTQRKIDDIVWNNSRDPRIEFLVLELEYLKQQEAKGVLYEPRF